MKNRGTERLIDLPKITQIVVLTSAYPCSNPKPLYCFSKTRKTNLMMAKVFCCNTAWFYNSLELSDGKKDKKTSSSQPGKYKNFKLTMGKYKPSRCSLNYWCPIVWFSFPEAGRFPQQHGSDSLGVQLLKLLNCYLLRDDQLSQPGCS